MIPRRMLRLSTAHRLLLAAWFGGLVLGELSDNFSQCRHFFHKTTPPRGISGPDYQPICQRYMNMYRFATLYHRLNRAPLYSAYQLKTAAGKRPKGLWKYEPQVTKTTGCCGKFPSGQIDIWQRFISVKRKEADSYQTWNAKQGARLSCET